MNVCIYISISAYFFFKNGTDLLRHSWALRMAWCCKVEAELQLGQQGCLMRAFFWLDVNSRTRGKVPPPVPPRWFWAPLASCRWIFPHAALPLIFILTLRCGWFVFLSSRFCTAEPALTHWLLQAPFLGEECSQKAVWPPSVSVDPVFTARLGVTGPARLGAASPAADDKYSLAAPQEGRNLWMVLLLHLKDQCVKFKDCNQKHIWCCFVSRWW